ncbi:MAG: (d)CMP kinase [Gammaproteobacteria bacterium]|tara:strand:+ start:738 stop:1421 length:684 start_codon:yes stop_codon:yes gene_type:complete
MTSNTSIITIDGLSGSGKSTISLLLAEKLKWNLLDSGILYRAVGYILNKQSIHVDSKEIVLEIIANIQLVSSQSFMYKVYFNEEDISGYLVNEEVGIEASRVSKYEYIRKALLPIQHSCVMSPGLIANGRDMGTKVFPDADLKLFFIADLSVRVQRRHQQLTELGQIIDIKDINKSLIERDERDLTRNISPLKAANDAIVLDSTKLNIESVLDKILELYKISVVRHK